jgi:nucleoside-diphosphate-sugar epimerase
MRSALIGHTGFVGGNLMAQTNFSDRYHSKTIGASAGRHFDLVVCCGAPAEKWRANQDPKGDWDNLSRLIDCLGKLEARRLILISTVDVFAAPRGVDEDSPIDSHHLAAYGKHRYLLERFVAGRFDALIVRLPGLFGPGLKKNVIYDFLHHNQVERVSSASVYQFYDLNNLWHDVQVAERAGLRLVHFAPEPVSVAEVADEAFGFPFHNRTDAPAAAYDFRSKHAALYGGSGGYLYRKGAVLQALRRFVASYRQEKRCA